MKQTLTDRFDTAISDLKVHPARMRTPERLKVATAMSRMQSSIRKVKKNQRVEAVEKLPDLLPVSPLTIICPYCAAKPGLACATHLAANLRSYMWLG